MNLMTDEEILMDGDYKQIILTTHRIRQENKAWGQVKLVSIMLEHITSCEYIKRSRPVFLIIGLLLIGVSFFIIGNGERYLAMPIAGGIILSGIILIYIYFYTIKRGLFISSPSAKVVLSTSGMKDENIKLFINRIEVAKNDRLLSLKNKPE